MIAVLVFFYTATSNGFAAAIQFIWGTPLIPPLERLRKKYLITNSKEQANCLLIHKGIKNRVFITGVRYEHSIWCRWPDSICIFCRWQKIEVATSVCTGGRNCPPDSSSAMGSSPFNSHIRKERSQLGPFFSWCGWQDSNLHVKDRGT